MHLIVTLAVTILGSLLAADTLHIKTGAIVEGRIIYEGPDDYAVITDGKFKRIPKGNVERIDRDKTEQKAAKPSGPCRAPAWEEIITKLAGQPWAADLREVPATVITTGSLRNIPYRSFQCSNGEIELNVYGDPESPVAVEIGLYKSRVTKTESQTLCRDFISSLLTHKTDKAIPLTLDAAGDLVVRDTVTFEITPPTANDAYGGWWVSIYNESALDNARANDEELKAISQPRALPADTKPSKPDTNDDKWKQDDLTRARPAPAAQPSSGGSVYVRGYYRKDGTYVHPHTRKK
ncbi:MAG: hypothetical protein QM783_04700 [Phycisphaerales bacterium]